jgi:hypothetical protein
MRFGLQPNQARFKVDLWRMRIGVWQHQWGALKLSVTLGK